MAKNIRFIYTDIKFTIKERYNKWWLDFYLPDGKRIRRSTELSSNQQNLTIIKRQIIPDIIIGLGKEPVEELQESKEWILDEFADEYFELHSTQIREHTNEKNKQHYKNHVSPYFGKRLISSLTPIELEKWQNRLLLKYRHLTVQKYRSVLYSILQKAYNNDIILKNPLEKVNAPKMQINNQQKEVLPFTHKELALILENSSGYIKNFISFMAATGMRPGEIVALKWSDVDFERKMISIERTRVRSKKGQKPKDGLTKTMSSNRKIDLLPIAEQALLEQMKLTVDATYIFLNQSNEPFYGHDIIGKRFREIIKQSGMKERPLYNLRHTFASQMISRGADIVWVSNMLGHKNVSITLSTYTKFIKEDDEVRIRNIEKMGTIMGTFSE